MGNTFKKVLFSLWAIGLVWAGSLNLVNATQVNPGVPWIEVPWDEWWDTWTEPRIITTVKNFINRVLWILWLIALIILLWWWFQMLTASGDETKYKKWFTILKQAALWLAVIFLAWIFVTAIFWLINQTAAEA